MHDFDILLIHEKHIYAIIKRATRRIDLYEDFSNSIFEKIQ